MRHKGSGICEHFIIRKSSLTAAVGVELMTVGVTNHNPSGWLKLCLSALNGCCCDQASTVMQVSHRPQTIHKFLIMTTFGPATGLQ